MRRKRIRDKRKIPFEEEHFFWYICRQATVNKSMYCVINRFNGQVVYCKTMSSALKAAWMAVSLRTGMSKLILDEEFDEKARILEGFPKGTVNNWGKKHWIPYNIKKMLVDEREVVSYLKSEHKMGYYLKKMGINKRVKIPDRKELDVYDKGFELPRGQRVCRK